MPKRGRGFVGGNYSDKLFTRIHQLVVFTLRIAPIGGMIIEVKSSLQLQQRILCKWKKLEWWLKVGPKHNHNYLRVVMCFLRCVLFSIEAMYAVLSTHFADVDDGSPLYNFCLLEFAVWSIMMSFHRAFLWRPSCGYVLMP